MNKILSLFMAVVSFFIGLSGGLYTGISYKTEERINIENEIMSSVQDNVLRKIQSDSFITNYATLVNTKIKEDEIDNSKNENKIQVSVSEQLVSPNAKLVIKKNFTKCSHSTVKVMDMPKEIVNLTKSELLKKYSGWELEKFDTDQIVLSRDIDANCEDHYVIKTDGDKIVVYNELDTDKLNVVEVINTNVELLGDEDKVKLIQGIKVYGKDELSSIVEDYNS